MADAATGGAVDAGGATGSTGAQAVGPSVVAWRLGYAGLIPFAGGALLLWLVRPEAHPYVALAMSGYAAVVIAFLGGIHWGLAMKSAPLVSAGPLAWGVVPSLVAWVAVMMPANAGLVIHGLMLLVCYAVDRRLYPAAGVASWLTLRFRLGALAAVACFIGAAGS